MQSTVTAKFQTTIPKPIREKLKLDINDALEWSYEKGKVVVYPVARRFLTHRNAVKVGKGNIADDIRRARRLRADGKK